jgi:hypothetical protein
MNNKVLAGIIVVVLVIALLPLAAKIMNKPATPAGPQETTGPAGNAGAEAGVAVAVEVVTALTQGNFNAAAAKFDTAMKSAMDAAKWNQAWSGVTAQLGPFKKQAGTRTSKVQGYDVVFVGCEFERGKVDLQVTLNASQQVSGLFIR